MATIDPTTKIPHVVPVCFVFDGKDIYTSLYAGSKRLRNVENGSKVALLIDKYVEENNEWKVLSGLLIYGKIIILTFHRNEKEFMYGWKLLIQKYPQYKHWADSDLKPKDPDKRRIVRMRPSKIVRWGFS